MILMPSSMQPSSLSMMWPPQRVKLTSTPSCLRALATRCPPGLGSAGALCSTTFTARSAILSSLRGPSRPLRSIQMNAVRLHMRGEVERVLPDQALGAVDVARLQRLDDGHVILDRALRPVVLGNGDLADGAHMDEQVLRQVGDQLALAQADDRGVERDVGLGIFLE